MSRDRKERNDEFSVHQQNQMDEILRKYSRILELESTSSEKIRRFHDELKNAVHKNPKFLNRIREDLKQFETILNEMYFRLLFLGASYPPDRDFHYYLYLLSDSKHSLKASNFKYIASLFEAKSDNPTRMAGLNLCILYLHDQGLPRKFLDFIKTHPSNYASIAKLLFDLNHFISTDLCQFYINWFNEEEKAMDLIDPIYKVFYIIIHEMNLSSHRSQAYDEKKQMVLVMSETFKEHFTMGINVSDYLPKLEKTIKLFNNLQLLTIENVKPIIASPNLMDEILKKLLPYLLENKTPTENQAFLTNLMQEIYYEPIKNITHQVISEERKMTFEPSVISIIDQFLWSTDKKAEKKAEPKNTPKHKPS